MRVSGDVRIEAPTQDVWRVFMEPDLLCRAVRGCEQVVRIDPRHYEARLAVKMQFMTVRAQVAGELIEAREPHHLVCDLTGETAGITGAFRGRLTLDLSPEGTGTRARYTIDGSLLGPLGGLGETIVRASTQKFANRFAETVAGVIKASPV